MRFLCDRRRVATLSSMDARLSYVTLVVRDLAASRRFYIEGLGWPVEFEAPDEVVMVRVGAKTMLSLWQEDKAADELGPIERPSGVLPFTLAHNLGSEAAVDAALAEAQAAGATVSAPIARDWGGYSGYFADVDGFRWEVAYNPSDDWLL